MRNTENSESHSTIADACFYRFYRYTWWQKNIFACIWEKTEGNIFSIIEKEIATEMVFGRDKPYLLSEDEPENHCTVRALTSKNILSINK